jgi:hypothetical protein
MSYGRFLKKNMGYPQLSCIKFIGSMKFHEILHVFMGFSMKSTNENHPATVGYGYAMTALLDAAPPAARRLRSSSQDWPWNSSPASGGYGGT